MSSSNVSLIARMVLGLAQSVPDAAAILEAAKARLHEVEPDDGLARVVGERIRQVDEEGFSPDADLRSSDGQLRLAAARYLVHGIDPELDRQLAKVWPWSPEWWKPKGLKRDIERGAAIAVAAVTRNARLSIPDSLDVGALCAELADQLDLRGLLALSTAEARWSGEEQIVVANIDGEVFCMVDPTVTPVGDQASMTTIVDPHLWRTREMRHHARVRVDYTSVGGRACSVTVDGELAVEVQRAVWSLG